jgi:Tfp pilus assembly protein PilN
MAMGRTDDRKTPRRVHVAIALAPGRMVAVSGPASRAPEVLESELVPATRAGWPGLDEALVALAAELGASRGTLDVVLLGRLAHAKVVPLPPVRRAELGTLVARNVRRHFAVRDEALVADAVRVERVREGVPAATLAACAPEAIVEAVEAAAAAAGLKIGRIVPGAVALAEAVCARVPAARRGHVAAVARTFAGAEVVLLRGGIVEGVHPLTVGPADDADSLAARIVAMLQRTAEDRGRVDAVVVCGSEEGDLDLRRALAGAEGAPPQPAAERVQHIPAEAVLAMGASLARDSVPALLPAAMIRARTRMQQRRTQVLVAASAVLLAASAGFHLHGLQRELDAVLARRAEVAPAVRRAKETRAGVEEVRGRLAALARLEREATVWTTELAALARALPDSAHLTTLAADSAGVRLGGLARSASAVVPALEASPRLARVALAAPVRWEAGDAGERFDIAAAREGRP